MAHKPLIALVGRPNVGKSTLFNRLVGERMAVTDEIPGTTRDRLMAEFDWRGRLFQVVDTGGIEVYEPKGARDEAPLAEGSADFVPQIRAQAMQAVQDADLVIMLVDADAGITAADEEVAEILRRTKKPVLVAANKADHISHVDNAVEFYALGLGEVFAISAIHGLGVGDLLDAVYAILEGEKFPEQDDEDDHLKIAIVGRPNVGKSSLLNSLLGEERVIVSPIAGTTRDSIDTHLEVDGQKFVLIDTAGIRRKGKTLEMAEKLSVIMARKALERADVAILLIDAVEGVTNLDANIAGYAVDSGCSVIIAVNKWDALEEKETNTIYEFERSLRMAMKFLDWAPIVTISALTGQRVTNIMPLVKRASVARNERVQTSRLNRFFEDAISQPKGGGTPAPVK